MNNMTPKSVSVYCLSLYILFLLIIDPTLAALIVCGPLQYLSKISHHCKLPAIDHSHLWGEFNFQEMLTMIKS